MKRLLSILFATMLAGQAWAADFKSGGLYYNITSANEPYTVAVTYEYNNTDNYCTLTSANIPETVIYNNKTYTVTSIGDWAFSKCRTLTTVTIPNTVTEIGSKAFYSCSFLTSLTIPNSVTSIGLDAFYCCTGLTSLTIPNGVVGSSSFLGCEGLTTVILGDGVTTIERSAFSLCKNITSINIPESVTKIGKGAFGGCDNLEYTLYKGCKYIGNDDNPYYVLLGVNSTSMTDLEIHRNCQVICDEAFANCSLTTVTINNDADFSQIQSLCFIKDGIRYRVLKKDTVEVVSNNYSGEVVIPSQVTAGNTFIVSMIGDYAFTKCEKVTSIIIPNSVTYIGIQAFIRCKSLKSISIPNSVKYIGGEAFYDCPALTKAEFASIKSLCEIKFGDKSANPLFNAHHLYINGEEVTNLEITNDIEVVGDGAFFNCSGLESVIIPESVTKIGENAFNNCSSLQSISIGSSVSEIGNQAFEGCNNVKKLSFNTNAVGTHFSGKTTLETLEIGSDVTSISGNAFSGCNKLQTVIIPTTITEIGANAFKGNKGQVICLAETPISLSYDPFPSNTVVYVPASSVNAYSVATVWKRKEILPWYNIAATSNDETKGTVEYNDYCGEGQNTTIKALPITGYHLTRWSDGEKNAVRTIKVEQNISLTAYFAIDTLNISAEPNNADFGSINGVGLYTYGANVELKAVPAAHYHFVKWSDEVTTVERTFDATTDVNLSAIFELDQHNITLSVEGNGAVTGSATYNYGDSTTITATPSSGSHFVKWSDNVKDATRGLLVSQDSSITAIFEEHTIAVDSAVAPTCSETGLTEGKHCPVCGETIVAQEVVTANGHTEVTDSAVAATCTKTGLTEGKHCSVCNAVLVEQKETPMVEHTLVTDAAVAATATETGLTEGSHCSVCGAVIVAQEVIPALGENQGGNNEGNENQGGNNEGNENQGGNNEGNGNQGGNNEGNENQGGNNEGNENQGGENNNPGTAVAETAANAINIYAYGNTIIVENATEEIRVYDAMGRLIVESPHCDVSTEIRVNTAGLYIVKVGNVVKRVMVN